MTNVLTIETAIAGIEAAIAKRGEGFVYTDEFGTCAYTGAEGDGTEVDTGEPLCIVGEVFHHAGFDLSTLDVWGRYAHLNESRPRTLAEFGWLEAPDGLLSALTKAQLAQDRGRTWGEAREAFREALGGAAR